MEPPRLVQPTAVANVSPVLDGWHLAPLPVGIPHYDFLSDGGSAAPPVERRHAAPGSRVEARCRRPIYFRLTVWNRVSPSGEISTPVYAVLWTQA